MLLVKCSYSYSFRKQFILERPTSTYVIVSKLSVVNVLTCFNLCFSRFEKSKYYLIGCVWLCDLMDCSLPGFSIHGILQARILEWVAIPSSRGSSQFRDQTHISVLKVDSLPSEATRETPGLKMTSLKYTFFKYLPESYFQNYINSFGSYDCQTTYVIIPYIFVII